jgi:hemolysin D
MTPDRNLVPAPARRLVRDPAKWRPDARRSDLRDFLPAALEIVETPASPLAGWFNGCICALVLFGLAWSYFGRLDVNAVASGKVQPPGRTKVVQPFEGGRVKEILVDNGRLVKAGDILVRLDETELAATRAGLAASLDGYKAEANRRHAAVIAAEVDGVDVAIAWDADVSAAARARETTVLRADLDRLSANLRSLAEQRREKQSRRETLVASIAAQNEVISPLREQVGMRDELYRRNVGSRLNLLDTLGTLKQAEATLASLTGQLAEADVAILEIEREMIKTRSSFVDDNEGKLAAAARQIEVTSQQLLGAEAKLSEMTLRAPITGIIQAMSVTTIGQVVQPGQELMQVVPADQPLQIEAYVLNSDAGFVAPGQRAVIKVDAFPFTRYGTIDGVVTSVANDAIPGQAAAQNLKDGSKGLSGTLSPTSAAERTQDLVFPILVEPSTRNFLVDGRRIDLQSGMTVTVEIKTEERRVIDYLFSPLVEIGSTALRER